MPNNNKSRGLFPGSYFSGSKKRMRRADMREKIYLAPGANGGELRKSLAMHGVNCFNLRICGAGKLARMALMRSGIAIDEDFVSTREEIAIVAKAAKDESYFKKATYSDIRNLAGAIRRMRSLVPNGDEAKRIAAILGKGIFADKNAALVSVYRKYKKILDYEKRLDSVSLIRRALEKCGAMDAEFFTLKEYPLSPLEKALLDKLSGGKVQETDIQAMFGIGQTSLKITGFKNCYGASNETETVLAEIYAGKNLDKCTFAVTDPETYGQLFFDYAVLYDMPIAFGCGIPIGNSNPARLLALYYRWMTDGFFGASAIGALLSSTAFDRDKLHRLYPKTDANFSWNVYKDLLGSISLTNDRKRNDERLYAFEKAVAEEEALTAPEAETTCRTVLAKKRCIPFLEVLAKELSLPAEEFIAKYAYIRKGTETNAQRLLMELDMAAAEAIYEELKIIRNSGVEQSAEDIISHVLKMTVKSGKSDSGKLFVSGVEEALSFVRENLYIVGLSASKYPGAPREDYLLLDADIKLFGAGAEYMTSEGKTSRRKGLLRSLASLASGLGTSINVSYAGLNVSELKRDNASSLVFELYRESNGKNTTFGELEAHIEKVGYFEPAISVTRKVGGAYNGGKKIIPAFGDGAKEAAEVRLDLNREYSPSALEHFFECPRRFMLSYTLGIREQEDEKPFEVIAANEKGTLAHSVMENLANSDMSLEAFLKLSGEYFDRFIAEHPPLVPQKVGDAKLDFLDMMETAYHMDPHREVILREEELHCVHESGVKIHGYPDRVEKLDDGSYLVVDFKSGKTVSHLQDDIETCLQIVIYAYFMEQKGYKISGGEFRYIDLGETVSCKYDEDMKRQLADKLASFKEHIENADFPISENADSTDKKRKNPCQYCKYGLVCGKTQKGAAKDEQKESIGKS